MNDRRDRIATFLEDLFTSRGPMVVVRIWIVLTDCITNKKYDKHLVIITGCPGTLLT